MYELLTSIDIDMTGILGMAGVHVVCQGSESVATLAGCVNHGSLFRQA
jgi:hypothetical protein